MWILFADDIPSMWGFLTAAIAAVFGTGGVFSIIVLVIRQRFKEREEESARKLKELADAHEAVKQADNRLYEELRSGKALALSSDEATKKLYQDKCIELMEASIESEKKDKTIQEQKECISALRQEIAELKRRRR